MDTGEDHSRDDVFSITRLTVMAGLRSQDGSRVQIDELGDNGGGSHVDCNTHIP